MNDERPPRAAEAVAAHPAVRRVELIGSRARGDHTEWSDWDYDVEVDDFAALARDIEGLVAGVDPLGTLWDRLAHRETFMLILEGPTKVDFIFNGVPRDFDPPYVVEAQNLAAVDVHMWDWSLWLTSKIAKGRDQLVSEELEKMYGYILSPMGAVERPADLASAVDIYKRSRDAAEARFGVELPRRLASEVEPVVRRVSQGSRKI